MNADALATEHAARLGRMDPLLPSSDPFAGRGNEAEILIAEDGESWASGVPFRSEVAADSSDSLWRALVEYRLIVRLAGPHPGRPLTEILTQWDEYLRRVAIPGEWDTAAVVPRPSRDTAGSAELLRQGFSATRVLAVRPADRLANPGPPAEPGVRIRPAEPGDLGTAVELFTELQQYDSQFGMVTLRANAGDLLTSDLESQLDRTDPTVWIAELYGRPLGLLRIQYPAEASWVAPYVSAERVGYLSTLHVAEAARSSGVGSALAAHAHQLFDEADVDAVLLHHALASPRSTPFWYSRGYRPLWTYWYRRPATL
ncbi:GNAT family N-acetyltransferase [Amycolatopsis sp. K13G38]|uniref:GNAT family N-acetyltransferase n=1 Tax=Amycolatopsis acididurans TaxID=2724524 RepID=A0ABX1J9M6_9PSEU|nr:GNAT family N-acetyltransferase [Amycolatopsis acididurans]NKQ56408.1 GNAT family N-acetyltransferase [Amycolatopsis acididurans]